MVDISELLDVLIEDAVGLVAKRMSQLSSQQHSRCRQRLQLPESALSFPSLVLRQLLGLISSFHLCELSPHALEFVLLLPALSDTPVFGFSYPYPFQPSLAASLVYRCAGQQSRARGRGSRRVMRRSRQCKLMLGSRQCKLTSRELGWLAGGLLEGGGEWCHAHRLLQVLLGKPG